MKDECEFETNDASPRTSASTQRPWLGLRAEVHRQPAPLNHLIPKLAIPLLKRSIQRSPGAGSLTLVVILTVAGSGCQILTYSSPQGERFSRCSIGSATSISSLVVEASTNGARRVELRGYTNDSTTALGAVTEAAVRAAIQGAK